MNQPTLTVRERKARALAFLKRVLRLLNPLPSVGGLEIGDAALRFLVIREGQLLLASLRLPPGVVAGGRIEDRAVFVGALKNLHGQVAPAGVPLYAVTLAPPEMVYTQTFSLPALPPRELEEAARLNLAMISPLETDTSSAGFEVLGPASGGAHQLDLLGGFAETRRINELIAALAEGGFRVVAVEFPALALVRAISAFGSSPFGEAPYLLVQAAGGGLALTVVRRARLYFTQFRPWQTLLEEGASGAGGSPREITREALRSFVVEEVRRVLNFYSSRWRDELGKALLAGGETANVIGEILARECGLAAQSLTLEGARELDPGWFPALGAAWRGLIPRARDRFLNLATAAVEAEYRTTRLQNFTRLWSKVAFTVLGALLATFLAAASYLAHRGRAAEVELRSLPFTAELNEIRALEEEARAFNALVTVADRARVRSAPLAPLFAKLKELGGDITFRRIAFQEAAVTVSGAAANDLTAVSFKNRLARDPAFADVSLPLAALRTNPDGSVEFTVTFTPLQPNASPLRGGE